MKIPKECYELYGKDLDGCSTQENEGCGRCKLVNQEYGMKIEEAIEHLEEINVIARTRHMCRSMDGDLEEGEAQVYRERFEAIKVGISALEKQIPKPPENKVHEKYKALGKNYYCSCGVMFVDFERNGTNYCGNCGQRLK